jgi:hypothetical protein
MMARVSPPLFYHAACGLTLASTARIPGLLTLDGLAVPDVLVLMRGLGGFVAAGRAVPLALVEDGVEDGVESDVESGVESDVESGAPFGAEAPWYVSGDRDATGTPWLTVWRSHDRGTYRFDYGEGAQFVVNACGTEVTVSWRAPLIEADAATYLLGPVLGFVMRLRGIVPMHASAVQVDGRAVLFAGDAWAGKSTTAAAFAMRGYAVLSDDIVPLSLSDGGVTASPGHPRLSIWSDSTEGLFGSTEALPAVSDTYPKRYLDLTTPGFAFHGVRAPVGAIYVLGARDPGLEAPRIAALPARVAFMSLVRHTYGGYLLDAPMRAREFEFLSDLVERVPVRSISFGEPIGRMGQWCEAIASDTNRVQGSLT